MRRGVTSDTKQVYAWSSWSWYSQAEQGFGAWPGKFLCHTQAFLRTCPLPVLDPLVSHMFSMGGTSYVKPHCHQP